MKTLAMIRPAPSHSPLLAALRRVRRHPSFVDMVLVGLVFVANFLLWLAL
ncbi:MAG: hypothetical protein IT458_04990 [Planctomycetes bacterium]|nr:hypothetical protein [Planctomycetota bacterium]